MQRAQLLRQVVLDSQYVVDEEMLADVMIARARKTRSLPEAASRNDARGSHVRSLSPCKHARSFRPLNLWMPLRWSRCDHAPVP